MNNKIGSRRGLVSLLSGMLLSMLIVGSAWSAVTSSPTSTVRGRAPVVTQSTIVSDNASGNGLIRHRRYLEYRYRRGVQRCGW